MSSMVTALIQHTGGRMTYLTEAFRDYANAPKNRIKYSETLECLFLSIEICIQMQVLVTSY